MRIVIDAMGSDNCPHTDVAGGVLAARELGCSITLVGDSVRIGQELSQHNTSGLAIDTVHAEQQVLMTDSPTQAGRDKPASSMHVGMALVRDQQADAFVTAGNTGAAMAIATLHTLGRVPGVKRPALGGIYPINGKNIVLLDLGANADSRPEWLLQFAVMGQVYSRTVLKIENPRIGLLSNGEEEGKGNAAIKEAAAILRTSGLHFIGNVEPKEIVAGAVDVVVSDGFVGNIFLKAFEASASYLTQTIRDEITRDVFSMLGGLLLRPAFKRVRRRVDTFEIGGAPLLGVNGVVIIGHGRSNATAIRNAARQASLAVEGRIIETIRQGLQDRTAH